MYFNPRPREGSDNIGLDIDKELNISIHAPVKGATKPQFQKQQW